MSDEKIILYEDGVSLSLRRWRPDKSDDVPPRTDFLLALGQLAKGEQSPNPEMVMGTLLRKANRLGLHGFRYVTTVVKEEKDRFLVAIESDEKEVGEAAIKEELRAEVAGVLCEHCLKVVRSIATPEANSCFRATDGSRCPPIWTTADRILALFGKGK